MSTQEMQSRHKPGSTSTTQPNTGSPHHVEGKVDAVNPCLLSRPQDEYVSGRVTCVCGQAISFRDESTGGFTLKHWDAHRQQCPSASQHQRQDTFTYSQENSSGALVTPHTKRRRAKRTEDERIAYLRSDPYVAQFEAFRVLCASCRKWIRLRPNSTYCSIPWDAHRKSCLAKKINNKNVYAMDARNELFTNDPNIGNFDAERIHCNVCNMCLTVSPDNHFQAAQSWLQHRAVCQKTAVASRSHSFDRSSSRPHPYLEKDSPRACIESSSRPLSRSDGAHVAHAPPSSSKAPNAPCTGPEPVRGEKDTPGQDARRRNADQRAAHLRSDPVVAEVEPGRVFCSLCQKWVQLRQDSSYCAYPWLQHRGKCISRFHKRLDQKGDQMDAHVDELDSESNEDGSPARESREERSLGHFPLSILVKPVSRPSEFHRHPMQREEGGRKRKSSLSLVPVDVGIERGRCEGRDHPLPPPPSDNRSRALHGFADLDSISGRRKFVLASIRHLFATTYEVTDVMTISGLLGFLNAAMPLDKFEEFDTAELVRMAAALHDQGQVLFEGDTVRPRRA